MQKGLDMKWMLRGVRSAAVVAVCSFFMTQTSNQSMYYAPLTSASPFPPSLYTNVLNAMVCMWGYFELLQKNHVELVEQELVVDAITGRMTLARSYADVLLRACHDGSLPLLVDDVFHLIDVCDHIEAAYKDVQRRGNDTGINLTVLFGMRDEFCQLLPV